MKHVSYGFLGTILTPNNGKNFLNLLPTLTVSPQNTREAYRVAQENNCIEILDELVKDYTIREDFKFLGEFYDKCIEKKKYALLPPPAFSTAGEEFKGVVKKLTEDQFHRGMLKKFGVCTDKYGVIFLNNVFLLKRILQKEKRIMDDLINLDHSLPLKGAVVYGLANSQIFLNHYPLKRLMSLLVTANENEVIDTNYMITNHPNQEELINFFPRKPKDFKEAHDAISTGIRKLTLENVPLEQELYYIHGKEIDDFIIEVPKWSHDLIKTSIELNHCVHSYTDRIRKKQCQVINLKRKGERIYTIELSKVNDFYEIIQFKGKFNKDITLTEIGDALINKILKLFQ